MTGEDDVIEGHEGDGIGLLDLVPLVDHWKPIVLGSAVCGLIGLGVAFLLAPFYTARTTIMPAQQQQSSLASAMASLGALSGLAGLAGGAGGIKNPADQYMALMQSITVEDRLVEKFKLREVYDVKYRFEARKALERNSRMSVGKKDGLISIEVDDRDPQRAADIANAYVDELMRLTSVLAVSEAQQRRVFFEKELKEARDQLSRAQQDLQASGFSTGALRVEPRSTAEGYARLKAEVTAAEVRLQVMRQTMAETSPDLQKQVAQVGALRDQLARLERASEHGSGPDYVTKYREFKYREALFEIFARQYELARVDESREGALIQVVDPALKPEYKSGPKRLTIALVTTFVSMLLLSVYFVLRQSWHKATRYPRTA